MSWAMKMVPHACFYIDSSLRSTLEGLELLYYNPEDKHARCLALEDLDRMWNNLSRNYHILPTLSVRTGLDLFFRVKKFPPGSEIIMSAINIPSVVKILNHHQLRIKSCDINIFNMEPSLKKFEALITEKTVAVLVAHIYGKRFDMQPIIDLCKPKNITVLEDCAEAFSGLHYTGHPDTDIAFFSFGTIKFATVFGGAILKLNNSCSQLFEIMNELHNTYPIQSRTEYAKKLSKYAFLSPIINSQFSARLGMSAFRMVGVDHKSVFVPMLRGFPTAFFEKIRQQPSVALLINLALRIAEFDDNKHIEEVKKKGDYMAQRMPNEVIVIGQQAKHVNYWLFPILVEHPTEFNNCLFDDHGVDSSRGTTQLKVIYNEGVNGTNNHTPFSVPHAKFLMDHVVYLPCHKLMPYRELDKVIFAVHQVAGKLRCKKLVVPSFS